METKTPCPVLAPVEHSEEDRAEYGKTQGYLALFESIKHRPPRVDWNR
jgi:hypothetical protein